MSEGIPDNLKPDDARVAKESRGSMFRFHVRLNVYISSRCYSDQIYVSCKSVQCTLSGYGCFVHSGRNKHLVIPLVRASGSVLAFAAWR